MYIRVEIIRQFEITETVFERWYTEFYDYFSDGAKPEALGRRYFTDEDVKLIGFIKKYAHESYASIRTRLKEGQIFQPVEDQIASLDERDKRIMELEEKIKELESHLKKRTAKTYIMQKWQYAIFVFYIDDAAQWLIYTSDGVGGGGELNTFQLPQSSEEKGLWFHMFLANAGLKGWELTAVDSPNYYFKRPIE